MYNPRKAAQVIAYFVLKNSKRPLAVLKAMKLVYLSDRESLLKWGFPILDELRVSMPHGPVNSSTYEYINGTQDPAPVGWSDFLTARANHEVGIAHRNLSATDLDELSTADLECLDTVWAKFGQMDRWQIRDWTHEKKNIPEWEDPHGSSTPIPLERILMALGKTDAVAQAEVVESFQNIGDVFADLESRATH